MLLSALADARGNQRARQAKEVQHHVHVVDVKVEKRAARPCGVGEPVAAPRRRVRVPLEEGRLYAAVGAGVDQALDLDVGRPETQALTDGQEPAALPRRGDHAVGRCGVEGHRLLAHHVAARPQRANRRVAVEVARQADVDGVQSAVGQKRVQVTEGAHGARLVSVAAHDRGRVAEIDLVVAEGRDPDSGDPAPGPQVGPPHHPDADDADPRHPRPATVYFCGGG